MYDVVIIGGGPAGLAAAVKLYDNGVKNILIIERENALGGILKQCIHDGFGLLRFKESLSGPEYAENFIEEIKKRNIKYLLDTMAIDLSKNKVTICNENGVKILETKAILLAMGCRERTQGMLNISGNRPCGVYTAGVAQSYMNIYNKMIGREVIILGSGDIGLIMARRFSLEGANVKMVVEINPYPSGLPRNVEQCLNDFNIPLLLNKSISYIHGKDRITGISIKDLDEFRNPIDESEKFFSCDTLILSVGLIPENELSKKAGVQLNEITNGASVNNNYMTNIETIFAAGNVLQVHDLVDYVSLEAENAAIAIVDYLKNKNKDITEKREILFDENISYTVPQYVDKNSDFTLSFRVKKPLGNVEIKVFNESNLIAKKKINNAIPATLIQIPIKKKNLKSAKLEVRI